jgi:lipid II:glycine glycyltransferase (peptidoglycan interpeptide bridge formation enzyme)
MTANLKPCSPDKWAGLLEAFADGNFYQTWAYGSVSWGASQLRHLVLEDSGNVVSIAQVRVVSVPPLGGMAYVRWGPCVQRRGAAWNPEAFRTILQALLDEFGQRRRFVVTVIPNVFAEDPHAAEAERILADLGYAPDHTWPPYRTLRVDLAPPLEVIRKRLDGKWRNQLNAAERNRLTVGEGTDDTLYETFVALYDEMMARKRFETTVNVRQFRRIQKALAAREKMRITLCMDADATQAGMVATEVGETGIYLLGATGDNGMKTKASYLLQWRMICHLREAGCRFYDLGGINPEVNPGVYHFKVGMGGVECRQLGRYDHAPSTSHHRALRWMEFCQRQWRRWRSRLEV